VTYARAMRTMRAAVLEAVDAPMVIDEVTIGDPRPGEVLVRVAHCGVCHSDLSVIDGSFPTPLPIVLGHEAAGVIEEVGAGVTSVAPGDHVVLMPTPSCGHCYFCTRGQPTLCAEHSGALFSQTMADGSTPLRRGDEVLYRGLATAGFAEYAVMAEVAVVKIPEYVPLVTACVLGCSVQTGVGAVLNTARVEEGATVLVLGAGGVGISVVQGAVLAGAATIMVSDPMAERREAAKRFGATHLVDPTTEDLASACFDLTGVGMDYAFEAAGQAALVEQSIGLIRNGGTIVCVGAAPLDQTITIAPAVTFTAMEKRLIGCCLGSANAQHEIPRLLSLWRTGRLDLDGMITGRVPLDQANEAIAAATDRRGVRTIIDIA
jgi:S-(hydroxymethyl)glutathione dehydrogenase/alcohol dehydrogenase